MEKSEHETEAMEDGGPTQLLWQHLSSQLIYFVLFQYASFPHMVLTLHSKVTNYLTLNTLKRCYYFINKKKQFVYMTYLI